VRPHVIASYRDIDVEPLPNRQVQLAARQARVQHLGERIETLQRLGVGNLPGRIELPARRFVQIAQAVVYRLSQVSQIQARLGEIRDFKRIGYLSQCEPARRQGPVVALLDLLGLRHAAGDNSHNRQQN
jgi:hypothetical protein